MAKFEILDWQAQAKQAESPPWKRALYALGRPALSWNAARCLSPATRRRWAPDLVLFRRGLPLEDRRRWALRGLAIQDTTILIQGTGTGWEVLSWARLRPKRIVATDLFAFPTWDDIAKKCFDSWGVRVEFHEAPLEKHPFLDAGTIDLCASDAVFEHCTDLRAVLSESRRLLRRGGRLYASVGPLWYGPGGDHFATRAGLGSVYAHVEQSAEEYANFFAQHRLPVEDFQSGGRYVELDLFSKLRVDEYLQAFRDAGFSQEWLVAEVCPLALQFERQFPERWAHLCLRLAGVASVDDLRTKGIIVQLRA